MIMINAVKGLAAVLLLAAMLAVCLAVDHYRAGAQPGRDLLGCRIEAVQRLA